MFALAGAACAGWRADPEAGLAPALAQLVRDLRVRHGAASVRVSDGRSHRYVKDAHGHDLRLSCHASGEAFDGYLSRAALADVRARKAFGLITYSGAMHHVHVSSCAREAGVRAHQVVNAKGWPLVARRAP
jgi:hypothetical protein